MECAKRTTGECLTQEQIKDIKRTFKHMDMDQDGKISTADLKKACRKLGVLLSKEDLKAIMKEADANGNGFIEYKEYEHLVGQRLVIANYKNKELMKEFRKFDKDGDGFITGEEIRETLRSSGAELDDEEVDKLIEEADANGDGKISFEEFVNTVCEKDW